MACLKGSGMVDSEMERLMRVVIGKMRTSRQDLRTAVGMKSREQVALEEDNIADRTSAVVAGRKDERRGGERGEEGERDLRERRESRGDHNLLGSLKV